MAPSGLQAGREVQSSLSLEDFLFGDVKGSFPSCIQGTPEIAVEGKRLGRGQLGFPDSLRFLSPWGPLDNSHCLHPPARQSQAEEGYYFSPTGTVSLFSGTKLGRGHELLPGGQE